MRYHELSPEGYFQRLKATGIIVELLDRAEIDHARRNPPAGTPAAVRGRYIREFGGDQEEITANWHAVYLGRGRAAKVIRLDRYRQRPTGPAAGSRRKTPRRKDSGG